MFDLFSKHHNFFHSLEITGSLQLCIITLYIPKEFNLHGLPVFLPINETIIKKPTVIDLKGFSEFLGDVKHQFWIDTSIYPWRLIFKNKFSVFAYKQVEVIKTQWPPIPKATNGLKLILCNTAAENFEISVILTKSW